MNAQSLASVFTGGDGSIAGRLLRYAGIVLAVSLALSLASIAWQGHAAFNTSNAGVTWGLPIITYLYLVLAATGLTFIASLAMIFGFEEFYPVVKRCVWLSLAMLIAGFTALALELGHPFRMLWALPTGMQYVSPMFWMGVFYTLYLVLLAWKFQRIQSGDWHSPLSFSIGLASFVSVVIAHSTLGLVFGMMSMRPMWFDGFMATYFLVVAALSGAAFIVIFTYLAYGFRQEKMPKPLRALKSGTTLPKVFATMIGLTIMMLVDRTVTGLWVNLEGFQVYQEMARSFVYQLGFWGGLVLPFVLMLSPRHQREARWQVLSASLVMVGLYIGFFGYVIGGQRVPMFKGAWVPELIDYVPSITEWTIAVAAFALAVTIYAFGEKFLNLAAAPGGKD